MNVTHPPGCDADRLRGLIDETLTDADTACVERHVETCEACQSHLLQLAAGNDSFIDELRTSITAPDPSQTPNIPNSDLPNSDAPPLPNSEAPDFLDATDDPASLGRFAGYDVRGVVGRGSSGVVLKAWDAALDRFIAIKVLHSSIAGDAAVRERFAREGRAAASVVHENVVAVHGVAEHRGLPYLIMPYVGAASLQRRIDRDGVMSAEDIAVIAMQTARGLSAAHDQGLIHRDIKPANLLTPDTVPRVLITDFGLARHADRSDLTRTGIVAGTPQYMSPEQARGATIDARTDLFSLGGVMHAMATGRPPFDGETPYAVIRRIIDDPHPPLAGSRSDLPAWLTEIIDRLLAKAPEDRFQTAAALADHLEACLAHHRHPDNTAPPDLPPVPNREPHPRRRWPVAVLSALLTAAVLVTVVLLTPRPGPSQPQPQPPASITIPTTSPDPDPAYPSPFNARSLDDLQTEIDALRDDLQTLRPSP